MVSIFEDISKTSDAIKASGNDLANLYSVALQAKEIYDIFRSDDKNIKKAMRVFANIDEHTALFDEPTLQAYRKFANQFSCAEVALHAHKEVHQKLAEAGTELVKLVTDTDDKEVGIPIVRTAAKNFKSLIHQMRQLAGWSATSTDDINNLGIANHIAVALTNFRLVAKVVEGKGKTNFEDLLEFMQASFGENFKPMAEAVNILHNLGHDAAVVKFTWLFSDGKAAENTWQWTCQTREQLLQIIATAQRLSKETMEPVSTELERALAGFDHTATDVKAKEVKDKHLLVEPTLDAAEDAFTEMGIDCPVLKQAREIVSASNVATVTWGLHQLQASPKADNIAEGTKVRKSIANIIDNTLML